MDEAGAWRPSSVINIIADSYVSSASSPRSCLVSAMDGVTAQTTCWGSCMTCSGVCWQAEVNPSSSKPSKLGKEEVPLQRGN